MSSDVREKVIARLNEELGSDVKNLSKCKEISESLEARRKELESMLNLVSSEVPSKVSDTARKVDDACDEIKLKCEEVTSLLGKIDEQNSVTEPMTETLRGYFNKINDLERLHVYVTVLDRIQERSNQIEFCLSVPDIERAVEEYSLLCKLCLQLINSKCTHLSNFANKTTQYWNSVLKKQLSEEFAVNMKHVQWPIVSSNILQSAPQPDAISKFQTTMRNLLKIHLPAELEDKPIVSSSLQVNFPPLTLPIQLMVLPLRKRFQYHFSGSRQTNRMDKPEWYFTQILTWIRDHEMFILKLVQPVYTDLNVGKLAKVELMTGLVEVAVEKLERDLEQVVYDDSLFCHTIDESLGFDRELRENHLYPQSLPSASSVLTQAQLFLKWINMERKFARYKMDEMLASETAWCTVSPEDKGTEVAHTFLAILSGMTDRYSTLIQPGHKLQFVELQLELTDDLRVSLLQVLHSERSDPLNSKLPDVLNTVAYLISSLHEWDMSPGMLLLDYYRSQQNEVPEEGSEEGGILKGALSLLNRLKEQLLTELSDAVMIELKARSRPYRKDKWYAMREEDLEVGIVNPTGCAMYQALADKLHLMEQRLSPNLFEILWPCVASQITIFLLEELVLENTFNPAGGKVLAQDVTKCLIPLFRIYTRHPESYFVLLEEACSLLSLTSVPMEAKKLAFSENTTNLEGFKCLPVPIKYLNNKQISLVLRRRLDGVPELM